MTPAEKRAYVLADNKLALNAGWGEELLALELKGADGGGHRFRHRGDRILDCLDRRPGRRIGAEDAGNPADDRLADPDSGKETSGVLERIV
jgi:hypothetical protein